tara:strand:+ start:762 stop:2441 length:1680 start_codon:yes stop_codon:yes gene_type:complete
MATTAESKVFKKASAENFKSILKRQKEDESDPKFAISDSLQEYQSQLERSAGYTSQAKLNDAEIRQEIVNFVIDYSVVELDSLKGMDFDDAKTQQQTTEKTIKEYEGLFKKGIISEEELAYIQATVGKTNAELKKVLGLSTKLSLSFRDFKKELKPLKLAKRIGLTNVPIIGKRIERAIESEERAEQRGISAKRQLRRKETKGALKGGGSTSTGAAAGTKGGREDIAKDATAGSLGMNLMPDTADSGLADSEEATEQERESDKQFDTSSNLLEKIYEESKLTNELLDGKKEDDKGFFEGIGSALLPLAALSGLGGIITSSITGLGSTLAGSMRSMLGLPPKAPKGPVGAKPKVLGTGTGTKAVTTTDKKDAKKTKVKTSTLVKNNVKKGAKIAGKVAGGAARVAGRVFLPLAAVMGIFDAAKGVAQAGDLLDKEEGEEITLRDKASSGFAGFLSGLTFGLVDKKKTAKFLAGDSDTPSVADQHDDLGLVKNDQKKLDNVEELKADKIEKLTIGNGEAGTTINNINNSSSNTTNKTEYGSTNIGTSNPDSTVKDQSVMIP